MVILSLTIDIMNVTLGILEQRERERESQPLDCFIIVYTGCWHCDRRMSCLFAYGFI